MGKKSNLVQNMELMQQKREELREKRLLMKLEKTQREQLNKESKRNVDYDFDCLIAQERILHGSKPHDQIPPSRKLTVIVRKRPLFPIESENGEIDCVSCTNPIVRVHEGKLRVDGITKYVENHSFEFDNVFSENETTHDLYACTLSTSLPAIFNLQAVITCFSYGQTGSGKTFTMRGMQDYYIDDLFRIKANYPSHILVVSIFEIYNSQCFDLLNERMQLNLYEDKFNNVQVQNIFEKVVWNEAQLQSIIEEASLIRKTSATEANEESSRSHCICQITVRESNGSQIGKLIMVDLAGSERGQDCQNNSKERRQEGADIGRSLLALKECIRAMDQNAQYVPFRGSKLTLILRDSFLNKSPNSRIIMLACICPGSSSSDHTVNTLRYADRLKERQIVCKQDQQPVKQYQQQHQTQERKQSPLNRKTTPKSRKDSSLAMTPPKVKSYSKSPSKYETPKPKQSISKSEYIQHRDAFSNKETDLHYIASLQPTISPISPLVMSYYETSSPTRQLKQSILGERSTSYQPNGQQQQLYQIHQSPQEHKQQQMSPIIQRIPKKMLEPIKKPIRNSEVSPLNQGRNTLVLKGDDMNNNQFSDQQKQSSENQNCKFADDSLILQKKMKSKLKQFRIDEDDAPIPVLDFRISKPLNQQVLVPLPQVQEIKGNQFVRKSFEFQQKDEIGRKIEVDQAQIFEMQMVAIQKDANLLTLESNLLTECQQIGFFNCDMDAYLHRFDKIVSKKLQIYNFMKSRIDELKKLREHNSEKFSRKRRKSQTLINQQQSS